MEGLLGTSDIFLRDRDNPALHFQHDGTDFPLTLYDRPALALSNLVLRGNVDAATRAIFSPQSLSPAELKTFTSELLKTTGTTNKLFKTILEITTNPLVIMGAIAMMVWPVKGGTSALLKIANGLGKAPGVLTRGMHGAMHNLGNVPGLSRAFGVMTREKGKLLTQWSNELAGYLDDFKAKVGRYPTEAEQLMASAHMQGFNVGLKEGEKVSGGIRHAVYHAYEILPKNKPLWENLQSQMSPELRSFADKMRQFYNSKWEFFQKDPAAFKRFLRANDAKGVFVDKYFPIQPRYTRLEGVALYGNLKSPGDYARALGATMRKFYSPHFKARGGLTVGNIKQLRQMQEMGMGGWVDDLIKAIDDQAIATENLLLENWNSVKGIPTVQGRAEIFAHNMENAFKKRGVSKMRLGSGDVARRALIDTGYQLDSLARTNPDRLPARIKSLAQQLSHPAQYDMTIIEPTRKYISSTAGEYVWSIMPYEAPELVQTGIAKGAKFTGMGPYIRRLTRVATTPTSWQREYVNNQLTPLIRGFKEFHGFKRAVDFGQFKANTLRWLEEHPLPKKLIDQPSLKWLKDYFGNFDATSIESIGANISSHFYLSTLGLNVSPSSKNLLQNLLTTIHIPGVNKTGILEGMKEFAARTGTFMQLKTKGMKTGEAFITAFDDYIDEMGQSTGMSKAMIAGGIEREGAIVPHVASIREKIEQGFLMPFTLTEQFNRLTGFYIGKNSALVPNAISPEFIKTYGSREAAAKAFGGLVNRAAHFPGGPEGMPKAILGLWSPLRQFMHFPLRYAGFLHSSALMGDGMSKVTTAARAVGASTAAYIGAKNLLGVDISAGLAAGAMPVPSYEGQPFYPWPLVPPIASVAGAAAQSLHKGEATDIKRTAALLVPGGLAIRRLYKTLGPKYADYKNSTPDGRIPVYNDKKALIGAFTPWQLTMKALGLQPTSEQAEYGAAKWLLAQREKIRGFRRDYLEALAANDNDKATKINTEFQKAYPELGPLQIKKSDITTIHNRREISRLHRILKGFPKDYQPLFNQMVSQASLSQMIDDLERQPLSADLYQTMLGGAQ